MNNLVRPILQNKKAKCGAFTLVEIMVVVVLLGIIVAGLTSLMRSSAKSMYWTVDRSVINNDIRKFSLKIDKEALDANFAYLYPSFTSTDYDQEDDRIEKGFSGDCLILVYTLVYTESSSETFSEPYYERIIVYYKELDKDGYGTIYRKEVEFPFAFIDQGPPAGAIKSRDMKFEAFLSAQQFLFDIAEKEEEVLKLSRDPASGINKLFRVADSETFVIDSKILHGRNTKLITEIYNLTISTRG